LIAATLTPSWPAQAYTHDDSLIHWVEYSQEAFDQAREEDKPIFLLVTAIWCHWCHVYEEKTLETKEVAQYLNENFVNILVDADQRQDLTRQYLAGGWPTTVFFAPNGTQLHAFSGHLPKEGLLDMLTQVTDLLAEGELDEIEDQRPPSQQSAVRSTEPTIELFRDLEGQFVEAIKGSFDPLYAGLGTGKKFPQGRTLDYLLTRYEQTRDEELLWMVAKTLDSITHGLYDPVAGGFFRYATQRDWTVPHYEKMLQENALLIKAYLHAYQLTGKAAYKDIALRSLDYLVGHLYDSEQGGFYGSQDAQEGYYRLSPEERAKAEEPRIDRTKYAQWNGEAILTILYAADALGEAKYREIAEKTLSFLQAHMITRDGALHYYDHQEQGAFLDGQLSDNAWVSLAMLEGYRSTGKKEYLDTAQLIVNYAVDRLCDTEGGFFERNSTNEDFYRKGELFGDTKPFDENGVMAYVLTEMMEVSQEARYTDQLKGTLAYLMANKEYGFDDYIYFIKAYEGFLGEAALPGQASSALDAAHSSQLPTNLFFLAILAFLAGILSFLSPCTLPLLPAYFAFTFQSSRRQIVAMTVAFFAGLATVFALLGASASAAGSFLNVHIASLTTVGGLTIMAFGLVTLVGKGFTGLRLVSRPEATLGGSFLFGATFALGWTPCIGPVLGGLLVLAAANQTVLEGAALLVVYALGLGLPLIVVSALFGRTDRNSLLWRILRGKGFMVEIWNHQLQLHTTNLVSGLLFVGLGLLVATGYLTLFNRYVPGDLQLWFMGFEERLGTFFQW